MEVFDTGQRDQWHHSHWEYSQINTLSMCPLPLLWTRSLFSLVPFLSFSIQYVALSLSPLRPLSFISPFILPPGGEGSGSSVTQNYIWTLFKPLKVELHFPLSWEVVMFQIKACDYWDWRGLVGAHRKKHEVEKLADCKAKANPSQWAGRDTLVQVIPECL